MQRKNKAIWEMTSFYIKENTLGEMNAIMAYCIVVMKLKLMPLCLKKRNQ